MATTKPRLTVILEHEDYSIIKRLSGLNGSSMSKTVSELVATVTPALLRVAETLEKIEQAKKDIGTAQENVFDGLKSSADDALNFLQTALQSTENQFDIFDEKLNEVLRSKTRH
jgi:ABC-type transporter Mla subunit MlaD